MRDRFDKQMQQLNTQLIEMGELCEQAIGLSAKALVNDDLSLVKQVDQLEDEIDHKERDIEDLCLKILLQQQPVAKDLRQVSAALKIITDMERIGDQASDIAEIVSMNTIDGTVNTIKIGSMAQAAVKMVNGCVEAYVEKDIALAEQVIRQDDIVDNLFSEIKSELIEMIHKNPSESEVVLDLLMISKYFERIGDHAENIAQWVVFSVTGVHEDGLQ